MGKEFHKAEDHSFQTIEPADSPPDEHLDIADLHPVRLMITADLGECSMLVRDVLELEIGSIVAMDKLAGDMTDIFVNGLPMGRGEVVVIGDSLHVRIGEIAGTGDESGEDEG